MLNTDKNLKLYYSISEVAAMFDVNESLLRFWENGVSATQSEGRGGGEYASTVRRTLRQ